MAAAYPSSGREWRFSGPAQPCAPVSEIAGRASDLPVPAPVASAFESACSAWLPRPYGHAERNNSLYRVEMPRATAVRDWAVEAGREPLMRVALCGYDGEHAMPADWECFEWKTSGGYAKLGAGRGRDNAARERVWFSPHCLKPGLQGALF